MGKYRWQVVVYGAHALIEEDHGSNPGACLSRIVSAVLLFYCPQDAGFFVAIFEK